MNTIFQGIFDGEGARIISALDFVLCLFVSLACGVLIALASAYPTRCSKSFRLTLTLLPAVVCAVIMMVNGNVGTGVAVAGAFSLVRFRSAPGSAREISMIFLAMGSGLIAGMGYLAYAVLFSLILCLAYLAFGVLFFCGKKNGECYKEIRITIPEDLDYTGVFDDLFREYTSSCELVRVKSTNLGSMFRLTYQVVLRNPKKEKEMIDRIRERNGNLEISVSKQEPSSSEL